MTLDLRATTTAAAVEAAATFPPTHAGSQVAGVSMLSQTDLESEGSRSRSGPCKRKTPSTQSRAPQDDSEIPERRSKIDLESERILDTLSKRVPRKNYITLCRHLDIGYDEAINILGKFKEDCEGATRDCLAKWKTRTGGNMAKLKIILQDAEVGDLAKYIKIDLELERILDTLSKHVPRKNYIKLCRHLVIGYDEAINILGKFKEDCEGATRDCLAKWKTRTGGNMAKLKEILQDAEVGDLAKYIK
eukprot:XP_011675828.1 PREDICTED: uncharacterized protein LOC105443874 [Strongylocentrotus purpuratus]